MLTKAELDRMADDLADSCDVPLDLAKVALSVGVALVGQGDGPEYIERLLEAACVSVAISCLAKALGDELQLPPEQVLKAVQMAAIHRSTLKASSIPALYQSIYDEARASLLAAKLAN